MEFHRRGKQEEGLEERGRASQRERERERARGREREREKRKSMRARRVRREESIGGESHKTIGE